MKAPSYLLSFLLRLFFKHHMINKHLFQRITGNALRKLIYNFSCLFFADIQNKAFFRCGRWVGYKLLWGKMIRKRIKIERTSDE